MTAPPAKAGQWRRISYFGSPNVRVKVLAVEKGDYGSGWGVRVRVPRCRCCGGYAEHVARRALSELTWIDAAYLVSRVRR